MSTELQKFKKWTDNINKRDTLLAHLYIRSKESKVLTPPDCFLMNILSSDSGWLIKGTDGHGVPYNDKPSPVPCFNLFEVNDKFYKALRTYYTHQKDYDRFEYAILLSKNKLGREVKRIINVKIGRPQNLKESHHFDWWTGRNALRPFNRCDVLRAEIPVNANKIFRQPVIRLDANTIIGVMVQYGQKSDLRSMLSRKGLAHAKIFSW